MAPDCCQAIFLECGIGKSGKVAASNNTLSYHKHSAVYDKALTSHNGSTSLIPGRGTQRWLNLTRIISGICRAAYQEYEPGQGHAGPSHN